MRRNSAGVVYSTLGLAVAAPLMVLLVVCIAQCAQYSSASIKVLTIAKQLSHFAANSQELDVQKQEQDCKALAVVLLQRSGTNGKLQKFRVLNTKDGDEDAVSVRMEVSIPLLSTIPTQPPFMMTDETFTTPLPINKVCGCLALSPSNVSASGFSDNSKAIYIPIIRPRKTNVVWAPPFDANLNSLRLIRGNSPIPPECQFNVVRNDGKTLY